MTKKKKFDFGFIGLGRMAEVVLRAILSTKATSPEKVIVSRRSKDELKRIGKAFKVHTTIDNTFVGAQASMLWLGVKPFQAFEILQEIKPFLSPGTVVLSMMAGISSKLLKQSLGSNIHIVRFMPNTPSLLRQGMTGVYFPSRLPQARQKVILKILGNLGKLEVVKREALLDAVTGLSGSGPAFVYEIAAGMLEGGIKSGLSYDQSHRLAAQTLLGAAQMLLTTQESPEKLIAQVVSKKGTTEAGLKVLKKRRSREALSEAVVAASLRAQKIREENDLCLLLDKF